MNDIRVEDHGSIVLLVPESDIAKQWIEENIGQEGYQPYWPTVLAEPRYVQTIIDGMESEGLTVA